MSVKMKKWFSALLVAMLVCGVALAENWDAPALKNPKERYETYFEKTDGSENMLFGLLDAMNDEAETVAEHGCLKAIISSVDAQGEKQSSIYTYVQDSEFGNMIISSIMPSPAFGATYAVGPRNYPVMFGVLGDPFESGTQEDFDWYWESYHFPFGRLELMHGIRQDENGHSYFLVKSDDRMSFEFVTGEDMEIVEIRVYELDQDGALALTTLVNFEYCAALEVPENVRAAMEKDFAN